MTPQKNCSFHLIQPWQDTGSRWNKFPITEEEKKKIRSDDFTYYSSAKRFSSEYGKQFAEIILSKIPAGETATIAIMMGGAEHLGALVEAYITKFHPNVQADFRYVPFPSSFLPQLYATPSIRHEMSLEDLRVQNADYIKKFDLMNHHTVVIVDTGLRGTQLNIMNNILKDLGYRGDVEGVLLAKQRSALNNLPVTALDVNEITMDDYRDNYFPSEVFRWAHVIDESNLRGKFSGEKNAFQRSNSEFTIAIDSEGKRRIIVNPIDSADEIENYKATLLGLWDRLSDEGQ